MATHDGPWPTGTPCWADLMVSDQDAAKAFYGELLGWQLEGGPAEFGGYLMGMLGGRPAAGIGPKPEQMAQLPSVWTTYLASDDADATYERGQQAGGQFMMPPFDVGGVGRMTMGVDAAGSAYGVWQPMEHTGFGIVNEPGAVCWNELHTGEFTTATGFYAQVFDVAWSPMSDTDEFRYSTMQVDGRDVGGALDDAHVPDGITGYWLTYFAVADTDTAVETTKRLGGTVLMEPADTPYGRMAVVTGPEGEVFGLIATESA